MKRSLINIVVLLVATSVASQAFASITVVAGDTVTMSLSSVYYVQNGDTGGEFTMTVTNPYSSSQALNGTLYTFCADPTTLMYTGTRYYVAAVKNANKLGYNLSGFGKWIYYEFAQGGNGVSGTGNIPGHETLTADLAGAIQEGIWSQLTNASNITALALSGWTVPTEYNAAGGIWDTWRTEYNAWIADPKNSDKLKDVNNVGIAQLQLGSSQGDPSVQNQMVLSVDLTPTGFNIVPEPASLAIWGLGSVLAAGVVCVRRRKANRA